MQWCVLSLVVVTLLAILLRFLTRKFTSNKTVVAHVDEFVGNLCSSVFMMELGVIGTMYGMYSMIFLLASFIHIFLKLTYFKHSGGYVSPLSFIASYYQEGGKICFSIIFAASIIVTQFSALYCGVKFAKYIWAFEDQFHVDATRVLCATAISAKHSWIFAALSEGFGVFVLASIDFITPTVFKEAVCALNCMILYYFFFHVSGTFINPIIATSLSFRCQGHQSDWEHFAVYWVAPAIGMILAWELWTRANKRMQRKIPEKIE